METPQQNRDPNRPYPQAGPDTVKAYESNFVEHGDADAYNEPPKKVDPVDPGFNPDPAPKHHVGSHDPITRDTHLEGDEAGGI